MLSQIGMHDGCRCSMGERNSVTEFVMALHEHTHPAYGNLSNCRTNQGHCDGLAMQSQMMSASGMAIGFMEAGGIESFFSHLPVLAFQSPAGRLTTECCLSHRYNLTQHGVARHEAFPFLFVSGYAFSFDFFLVCIITFSLGCIQCGGSFPGPVQLDMSRRHRSK